MFAFDPTTGQLRNMGPRPDLEVPDEPVAPISDYGYNYGDGGGDGGSFARGGIASLAQGGQSHLGDYSDGGRLLRGPGDGVSDSIPASIGDKRPARLADGEFVVPARIVSELGNGSTEAGARKLYAMMDRVQKNRNKTVGKAGSLWIAALRSCYRHERRRQTGVVWRQSGRPEHVSCVCESGAHMGRHD
jgi:hypothetical protein